MKRAIVAALVAGVAATSSGASFAAADAPGFYVFAGVGYQFPGEASVRSVDPGNNTSIFGNTIKGSGDDGAAYRVGGGYRVNPWLRTDVFLGYGSFEYHGTVLNTHVSADVSFFGGGVNGYIDFQGLTRTDLLGFEPYVGVGVGVVRTLVTSPRADFDLAPGTQNRSPSGTRVNPAFALYAGTGLRVARFIDQAPRNLVIDIGYSYMHLGKAGAGAGIINNFTNGVPTGSFPDPGTEGEAASNAINFVVRWEF